MKILAGLLSSLLVVLVLSSCLTLALRQTVLNTTYISNKISSTHLTTDISAALPAVISSKAGDGPDTKQVAAVAQKVLTPQALQTKVDLALTQLNDYLNRSGPTPQLDLRDLAAQAKAQGFELPAEVTTQPFTLKSETAQKIKQGYEIGNKAYFVSLTTTLVLLLILFLICVKEKTYKFLISLFLFSALLQTALFVITKYLPSFIAPKIPQSDVAFRSLQTAAEAFAWSVLSDVGQWFLVFAITFFVLGFVTLGFAAISRIRHKRAV